ncbi:MAG: DinB family protein [Anaerolineaceae bacterium]
MITIHDYVRLLKSNIEIIKLQVADLTMDEMLIQPVNGGNCMLWVLGHLADNLQQILKIVGGTLPENQLDLSLFARGSQPITGSEAGLPTPEQLLTAYDTLHQMVISQLGQSEETYFDQEVELWPGSKSTRGWYATFFSFHHSYHIGQLELLRNLAGHTEKLI